MLLRSLEETSSIVSSNTTFINWSYPRRSPDTRRLPFSFTKHSDTVQNEYKEFDRDEHTADLLVHVPAENNKGQYNDVNVINHYRSRSGPSTFGISTTQTGQ